MNERIVISPKTKVMQLLDAYPELENLLINTVPAFEKLKNPVLRKTVARITSLQQAAAIGGVKVEDLINTLRQAVGQDQIAEDAVTQYITDQPSWFDESQVVKSFDAQPMLAAGEHPVNQVMADLADLSVGTIYKLTAPFLPAPLIDKATSLGFSHWIDQQAEALYIIYFYQSGEKDSP
jgi:hypothetical protein